MIACMVLKLEYEYELNCQEKSKICKFISKRRIISLRHSFTLWRIWLNFMALSLVFIRRLFQFSLFFPPDFQLFRPEHHWGDLSSRNVHLVHQNCYRISFILMYLTNIYKGKVPLVFRLSIEYYCCFVGDRILLLLCRW
jgi:hypothetical protein